MLQSNLNIELNQTLVDRFKIIRKVGHGSFGEVYNAIDLKSNEELALKIEIQNEEQYSQLQHECKIYQTMQGTEGFPQLIWTGNDNQERKILAMELLGQNLEQLLSLCQRKMSMKTVLMIADQMLKRIENLHSKNYLYRDIKPENFLIGKGKSTNIIFIIDFGLAKRYKDQKTGNHIQYRDNKGLIGTARFVSINTHLGIEQSRRDDLESLVYLWIYLIKGRLPWQGIVADTKEEKYEKMKQKKLATTVDQLCEGLPEEFKVYLNYCRQLKFEEQPDYFKLKQMIKELFFKLDFIWDHIYDWMQIDDKDEKEFLSQKKNYLQNSEDDYRDYKKGSTNYESCKEESANKFEQIKFRNSTLTNENQSYTKSQSNQNVKLDEKKEQINFKLSSPDKNIIKINLNQFKIQPNLFANLFQTISTNSQTNNSLGQQQQLQPQQQSQQQLQQQQKPSLFFVETGKDFN